MSGEPVDNSAEFQPRTREIIENEIGSVLYRINLLEIEFGPLSQRVDSLPEDQRQAIDDLVVRLGDEDVPEEELREAFSGDVLPLALELRDGMGRLKGLYEEGSRLDRELLPYRKADFEKILQNLSARVKFDAVFEYHGDSKKVKTGSDLLINTVSDLYLLRRYQYEALHSEGERDFAYYDFACHTLETFSKEWEEKGFLFDQEKEGYKYDQSFGQPVRAERLQKAASLKEILDELQEYNRLSLIYKIKLTTRYPLDPELSEVQRVLGYTKEERDWGFEDFEEVDFDPGLVTAAARFAERRVAFHRATGHLMPTTETLEDERKRIDVTENGNVDQDIRVEGFEAPEGMKAVVTPDGLIDEVKRILPPDFVRGLKALVHKDSPGVDDISDPEVDVVGRFVPKFDQDGNLTEAEIRVFQKLFAPEGSDQRQVALIWSEFMDTTYHEFGHNAHHVMRLDEMREWEKVLAADKTAVTAYTQYSRSVNENRGKREDFADSFMLFVRNPAVLSVISPLRLQFMFDYFRRRIRTDQWDDFRVHVANQLTASLKAWENLGYNSESIRRIYLAHEDQR